MIYTITSVAGGPPCSVRIQTVGCNPPACKNLTLQLPLPGSSGGCSGAVVAPQGLYSAGDLASLNPPMPAVLQLGEQLAVPWGL